ncbi:unnamed protein product [Microthlaspi erraticum]|uniref:Uncharacterized protein n=1 Tax=Microthlaspi erraticum TaxID=1685480 RepID=A0A6D2KS81_9BRAS|nr:unnamed protein product [Microthlaspi erraticum]
MEESDKTTALKKAYAEIILNTAKESAARVMVSDRKSARFHHDLSGTKEEALRLLVRLKEMIDAKTVEAEIESSNQQQQIDVLEAQLQEAEEIITDLRSELRWVRDKLEKARVKELQERNVVVNKEEEATVSAQKADPEVVAVGSLHLDLDVADSCFSVVSDSLPNETSLHDDESGNDVEKVDDVLSVDTLKGCDACESESNGDIISEKLELSRNGCTQRIHALERKASEAKSSPSANEEEQCTTEKDSEENLSSGKVNGDETGTSGNTRSIVLALRASSAEVITIPSNALGIKKPSKSRKSRERRKRRWGKQKARSVRPQSQLIKPCQTQSDLPCSKISMEVSDGGDLMETHISVEREDVDALSACKALEEHLQHKRTLYSGDISIIRKGNKRKIVENVVEACEESDLVPVSVEYGEIKAGMPENETEIKSLPQLHPELTSFKCNVDVTSGSTNATVTSVTATNQPTAEDLKPWKEDVLVKCVGEEDIVAPSTKMSSELVNLHSVSKVTEVASDQISESARAHGGRLVRFTFQRKRKKGSLNANNDNSSLQKKEVDEKKNNDQDLTESTLSHESSRETPKLAETATQLKSLPES